MRPPEGMTIRTVGHADGAIVVEVTADEVAHRCPPAGSGVMPCCGRTPFEVPRFHRLTEDPAQVTCDPTGAVGE